VLDKVTIESETEYILLIDVAIGAQISKGIPFINTAR